jgi:hypothetical protein
VSIDRIFYCDAADCERHVQTMDTHAPAGFLTVTGDHQGRHHFCSWDCVLKYAAAMEPIEIIPLHDGDAP